MTGTKIRKESGFQNLPPDLQKAEPPKNKEKAYDALRN